MIKRVLLLVPILLISCTSRIEKPQSKSLKREVSSATKLLKPVLVDINFSKLEQVLAERLSPAKEVTVYVFTSKIIPDREPTGFITHSILFSKDNQEDFYCTFVSDPKNTASRLSDCDSDEKWPELSKPIRNSDIDLVIKRY